MKILIILFLAFVLSTNIEKIIYHDLSLNNGKAHIMVNLKEQTDFSKHKLNFNHDQLGEYVMKTLQSVAYKSQKPIIDYLSRKNVSFKTFWIQNSIQVNYATEEIINWLSKHPAVHKIYSNEPVYAEIPKQFVSDVKTSGKDGIEWNIKWIKGDKLWEKGHFGKGIVVGVADTGTQTVHEALIQHYRGYNGSNEVENNGNWYDGVTNPPFRCSGQCPCNVTYGCDENSHGTHCTGTVCGGVGNNKIGVAPEAKWIACRSFSNTQWAPSSFISCLQFFAAPTDVHGRNPNPNIRPHITSHSYGCNAGLRCPDSEALKPSADALKAAGVYVVVAAHNYGPSCSTIGLQPGHYESVLTIGATDFNSDNIARFSGRGPISVDNSRRRKPDLTGPGVNVRSSVPGNRYASYSGTSMATPTVAGGIALLWSAKPSLIRNIDKTTEILQKTAAHQRSNECSSNGSPNNVYGYGTVNIEKALLEAEKQGF